MNAERSTMVFGEVASSGIARGPAFVCGCSGDLAVPRRTIDASDAATEMARFDAAIFEAEHDLLEVQEKVQKQLGDQEAGIFKAHMLMLHDSLLRKTVSDLCLTNKMNVEAALDEAIVALASRFARMDNPYFRERAADVRDVGKRLLDVLVKGQRPEVPVVPDGCVVVTSELLPSTIVQLDSRTIGGIIVEKGGQTAHATILARARRIPLLIRVPDATKVIRTGDPLIVDGLAGRVFIHPTPDIRHEYDRLEADLQAHRTALNRLIELPAVTQDGVAIKLCANIGKVGDAVAAATVNADGVGLYRTEFVFLVQDHFPSEQEQYQMYRATADRLKPREVVIRALDIGSDKLLPYFPLPKEVNPSLGCRGTRLLLANPHILQAQLRAILRLSATHPVSVLFPMIGGMEELLEAKAIMESVKVSLTVEHLPFNPSIPVGAMIETPAAAIMTNRLAPEVDFFSVGTNDLVQYLLTTDRASSEMTSYYEPFHPAILQVLASVVGVANANGKSVSICGEIAGNPAYTQLLLGLGYRNLSVSPGEILEIKNVIRSTNLTQAEEFARGVLELDTIQEIKARLRVANSAATNEVPMDFQE